MQPLGGMNLRRAGEAAGRRYGAGRASRSPKGRLPTDSSILSADDSGPFSFPPQPPPFAHDGRRPGIGLPRKHSGEDQGNLTVHLPSIVTTMAAEDGVGCSQACAGGTQR